MMRFFTSLLVLFCCYVIQAEISVHSDFEGGSVEVLEMDSEKQFMKVMPAAHKGKGWRCWWYFRVDGLKAASDLILEVGDAPWATPDRSHFSDDGGKSWNHIPHVGTREGKKIRYRIPIAKESILLAWGPPFTATDSQKLVDALAEKHEVASSFNLATTREDRPTPALRVTASGDSSKRKVIWLQARQHAWESGGSWVAKGVADYLVSDVDSAKALREQAVIYLVPVMDIDNVARGAGGKSQLPQDHNRDWSDAPHWRAVVAAQERILKWDKDGRFAFFCDLHNPGMQDRFPYFYIPPRDQLSGEKVQRLNEFLAVAKGEITGSLKFTGRAVESGPTYDPKNWQKISMNWVAQNTGDEVVAATLETSWNTPSSSFGNYEEVGRQLGEAISKFQIESNQR